MPGERPHGAPPPATTRDLHPCHGAGGLQHLSQAPPKDQPPSSGTARATKEAGSRALTRDPPGTQPGQTRAVTPQATLLQPHHLHGSSGKGGGPHTPPVKSHPGAQVWLASKVDSSSPQLYGLNIISPKAKPTLDEALEGWPLEAPQDSQAEACHRPSRPGAEALPTPKELHSQRCFQEDPSSFTSSNYTSPSATPGPPRALPSNGASPPSLATLPELQASRASSWPPAAEDNFPGANFRVSPTESEPFCEGSRPGSPRGSPFPCPLQARAPREDAAGQGYAHGTLAFSFHQPPGRWPEVAMGTNPAYPLPPTPLPQPCYPGQLGSVESAGNHSQALSPSGAVPRAPRPFPDSLHKNLTEVLPERPPAGHEGLGSPRVPPNPGSQRHFAGQAYGGSKVGSSPGPGDTELAAPGVLPARLPQLWDSTAAPYPEHPPPTSSAPFFDNPGQRLCLPQSPTVPWSSILPSPSPSPHQMEVLSQLPVPRGAAEWQEGSQGALGVAGQAPGPGETLAALRTSPGQPGSSPGLFPYSGLKDPAAQALFFGGTQPQASPRGAPGLPPPRVVGVSPSESPLPSPATNTAGSSTCSSLSPLSSSPANPSSEDSQLPVPLGPLGFFLPAPQPQDTGSPFQSPEPCNTVPAHFPLPSEGLGPEGALEFRGSEGHRAGKDGLRGLTRGPAAYAAHHFPLSSASLDQLDVLLTCRQCDRNYSSLAAFLEHRQFCGLMLARHRPQGLPAALKVPAPTHPGLLGHSQTIPFLLAGDMQTDGKDDALRTSFLPGLATPPFPLPASDLDLEDNAKLDSLITEALNGMQDPSDSPEIDSSFIDVFTDEDPPGLRGPGTGQPPSTRASATPEHSTQPLPLVGGPTPKSRAPCPGDRACAAQSEPNTPSLGPAPKEAAVPSPGRQPRRGKQLRLFWKELDAAHGAKGPSRTPGPRPRRRGRSTHQPPPYPQDLLPSAETRSAKRLRLPPRRDPKKRRARRGGSWSKELIHKIVLQKNKLHRAQVPSRAPQGRLGDNDQASESEEEGPGPRGPGLRGRSHRGRRQRRLSRKMKEADLGRGPSKVGRPGPGEQKGSPTPGQPYSPDGDPKWTGHPTGAAKDTATLEESQPSPGLHQAAQMPEAAEDLLPDPTKLREVPTWERGCPRPHTAEHPRLGRGDTSRPRPSGSHPNVPPSSKVPRPGDSALQGTPSCTESPKPRDQEDTPAHQPRDSQTSASKPSRVADPEPGSPFKSSDLGYNPAHISRDAVGVPAAGKGPQPPSIGSTELSLGPKDLAVDTLPASSSYLGQDHVNPLEPKLPKNTPYSPAQSPLTLESTSFFAGLPEDRFDPPLYDAVSPHKATLVPPACADPLPRKPPIEPLFPPLLLLDEVSPVLPSPFPDLSGPKPFHKRCPREDVAAPSPAPGSGKRNEYNAAFMTNLSEDELEIKRLVSELESQLQRREGTPGAPEEPGEAVHAASPMPACQAVPLCNDEAHLTGPGERGPHQEGVRTAMSPTKGVLNLGEQPSATHNPGKEAPLPGCHKDLASGAPLGTKGYSLRILSAQESRNCKTEADSRPPLDVGLPEPLEHPEDPLEPRGSARHGPGRDLLSSASVKSTRTQESKGSPLLPPPESHGCLATPAPDQGLQDRGDSSLDATPAPDDGHSNASKGPTPGRPGRPGALAEGAAFQDPEGPSHPGPRPGPAPSPSHPFQVLGARADSKSGVQVSHESPPASTHRPRHGGPPGPGGDTVTGGSPGGVQDTATCTVPEEDRPLGSPGQAEKPKAQGKARQHLPEAWRSPGAPGNSAKARALPRAPRSAGAKARLQGGSMALSLQQRMQPATSPRHPSETAAYTQQGYKDRLPGEAASLTPAPSSLEHTPQEALPSVSSGGASWVQSSAGAEAGRFPETPPSLMTSLCGPEAVPPPTLPGASSPKDWPDLSHIPAHTPTQSQDSPGSSTSGTLEDFRGGPGGSPAQATHPRPGVPMAGRRHSAETVPTDPATEAGRALGMPDPTSHPLCPTLFLGHSIRATPTDPTSLGSTQPGPYPCVEQEVGAVSQGREDAGTSDVPQGPRASNRALAASCSPGAASPRNTAGDFGSKSPQHHIGVPRQTPPGSKQKPHGCKKKPEPTEKRKSQALPRPPVPCVTCEMCSASFRSGPGLSRHKARKHRPLVGAAPGCEALDKKSRRAPGKEKPSHAVMQPNHPAGPPPRQGSTAPEGRSGPETEQGAERGPRAPGCPLNQQPHPPKPSPAQPEVNNLHPRQTERREGPRRSRGPRDSPSTMAPKPQNVGKGRARRPRGEHGTAAWCHSKPAAPNCTPEGQQGADRRCCAQWTLQPEVPSGGRSPPGRSRGGVPWGTPKGWKGALTSGLWGAAVARTSHKDPSPESVGETAEDCGGPQGEPSSGVRAGTLVLPVASSSDTDSTVRSDMPGFLDTPETLSAAPEAPSPGCGHSASLLDDDVSFAQLFPPGGRFARKKNPRVYGKRCRRPRCRPPTEPLSQARSDLPSSAWLPTDLSDSGSLCLSCEDLWDNEPMDLPEPWLLDGALSSSPPCLDLWAPEPSREADCVGEAPSCGASDDQAETIPELHRVPRSWRDLGVPPQEPLSGPGDVSPEPPNLEREGYEEGPPGNTEDLEMAGTTLETQGLCFPGPREDLTCVASTSALNLQEEADRPSQALGKERPAPSRKGSFKCRVCFRRFHGLGELDLHRLAHSATPPPTCYMCVERRFGSRQLLREHLQEKHVQGQAGPWACGMCLKEVADVWMYNQHLREHAALFARRGQVRRARSELPAGSGDEGASAERATAQRGASAAGRRAEEAALMDWAGLASPESPHDASTPPSLPGGDGPATPSPCPGPRPHSEAPLGASPVHADCKDPSRDCHHCGKRFPKPFKLQRHLAVHSPQRVYLCPRCPRVYAAHRELRAHLGGAHGARPEAREVAPTPLFACERCADVARVTRRAFACSACNYTFARREQLDRHREKHRRACPRPCALRGVRRPRAPQGALPPKRRRVAGPGADGPVSPGSPALPRLCLQAAPGAASSPERLEDTAERPDASTASADLPPPALSPLPDAQVECREDREPDRAMTRPEDEASVDSPGSQRHQAPPVSGKRGTPGGRGRYSRHSSPGEPSLLPKEKQVSSCHVVPDRGTAGPSHEGDAPKLRICQSASKLRPVATTPGRTLKLPGQPRKPTETGSPAPGELAPGPENRMKPAISKTRLRPSSQGGGGACPGTKTAGGSQPQLASGRLQSETATTPAKPNGPSQSPAPHSPPPRAQAKGSPKGTQGCSGPQEKAEGGEKRRKGPGPAKRDSTGSSGRAPPTPDRPPRAPRKQATPSRVLPTKPRLSSQIGKTRPPPWETRKGEPGPGHRREVLGKAFPQARKGRSVSSTRPTELRDHRTAESQSDLLSQLFGQRLTSFKIPLKKDTSE
nr:zinc finger protein 469 [Cavia porcellus]